MLSVVQYLSVNQTTTSICFQVKQALEYHNIKKRQGVKIISVSSTAMILDAFGNQSPQVFT